MSHRYARILRFVPSLEGGRVCTYDPVENILRISRVAYDALTERDQRKVARADRTILVTELASNDGYAVPAHTVFESLGRAVG